MMLEYVHPDLGEEVHAIAGYYVAQEEGRLPYDGREVLYVVGRACVEASCCVAGTWDYVQVPGFVVKWHVRGEGSEKLVSEVEPVEKEEDRIEIRRALTKLYPRAQITVS